MATNMEKITKALVKYGLSDVNGIAEVTKISKPAIYKLAAQNNASFTLSNGIMVLKEEHKAMDSAKEGTVNKECEKEHVPDYLRVKDGTLVYDYKQVIKPSLIKDFLEDIIREDSLDNYDDGMLRTATVMFTQELKRRKEGEK